MKRVNYLFAVLFILIISCDYFFPTTDDISGYSENPVIIKYNEKEEKRIRLLWRLFREEYNIDEDSAEFKIEPVTSQFRSLKFNPPLYIFPPDFWENSEEDIRNQFMLFYDKWIDLFGADYAKAEYIDVNKHTLENYISFQQKFSKGDKYFPIVKFPHVSFRFNADGRLEYVESTAIPNIRIELPNTVNLERMLYNIEGKTIKVDGKTHTITDEYRISARKDDFHYYAKYEEDRVLVYLLVQISASKYLYPGHSLWVPIYCHPETAEIIYFYVDHPY
ncbi:hypothetical protein ACFL4T_08375 [candidate division KSB1 bacterium]